MRAGIRLVATLKDSDASDLLDHLDFENPFRQM
jgi:hypothetical protein